MLLPLPLVLPHPLAINSAAEARVCVLKVGAVLSTR